MKADQPILFLNFDGVLHPMRVGVALFEYTSLLVDALAPHPDVHIVLSTTWVPVLGFDEAKNRLPAELQARVVGATYDPQYKLDMPPSWWSSLTRYTQIANYVKLHSLTRWLAIDDDTHGWPAERRNSLVRTSALLGLAHPDAVPELADKLLRLYD